MKAPDNEILHLIRSRIADYDGADVAKARERLIEFWRKANPAAAAEPVSGVHRPLVMISKYKPSDKEPDETWTNDVYQVTLRRRPDRVFGTRDDMIQLGISSLDGTARHDWRDFQGIKNQLAGPECEAFELYPAESRLMDPSNYYTLWCFPGLRRIKVGTDEPRRVWNADEALAPQRGFEGRP